MSTKPINVVVTVAVLGWFVVGSTMAWSNIASSVGAEAGMTTSDVASTPDRQADMTKVAVASTPAGEADIAKVDIASRLGQAYLTKSDFDQAFADATAVSRRDNTPANREKLRATGWKRIIASR
jgi:hypothetical protein